MKTMTCKQLGGACDEEFHSNTFEEMVQLSQKHGMEMSAKGDAAHLEAMQEVGEKMSDPKAMQEWVESVQAEFDALPEDK